MSSFPIVLIYISALTILYSAGTGFYLASGLEPSPTLDFLYQVGFLCSVIWWLRADSSSHKVSPVYCLGLLVSIAWMIVVPYHLLKTRGAKGLLPILALFGVFVAAQFITAIAYIVLTGGQ